MNVSRNETEMKMVTFAGICKHLQGFRNCSKQKLKNVTKVVWSEVTTDVPIHKCCTGYKNMSDACVPICSTECINGVCVSPDKCECNVGFMPDKDRYGSVHGHKWHQKPLNNNYIHNWMANLLHYFIWFICDSFFCIVSGFFLFESHYTVHTNAIQCAMVVRMVNALCRIHANALMVINGIPTKISAFQFVQRIARMENVSARTIVPVMKTIILTTHLTHVHRVAKVVVYLVLALLQINALVLLTID